MAIRIVTPTSYDDWKPFDQVMAASFGEPWKQPTAEEIEAADVEVPLAMRIGVADGDELLGCCCAYEFELTLPGGCAVAVAGLSGVGGDATKRGRGALGAMMTEHLDRAKERGHAASLLNASEAGIYGRYGYGHATTMVGYEIDPREAAFRLPPQAPGSFEQIHELLPNADLFAAAYDRVARVVPGTGSRDEWWWKQVLGEQAAWRGGGKQLGVIHRDADGEPDGYLLYKMENQPDWIITDALVIRELAAASIETELALFQHATDVPLQRKVKWPDGPIDFAARHRLVDPRQLHVVDQHDLLWLRPLNVPELLSSRTYSADGSFVIAIDDDRYEDQRGPWRLDIERGIGNASASDDAPDITLAPEHLGMVLLGDHRLQQLAHSGLLADLPPADPSVVRRLDQALLTDRRPYNFSKF